MNDCRLSLRSPFADLPIEAAPGRGVTFADRSTLAIARIVARANRSAEIAARVQAIYGIELPREPRRVGGHDVAFVAVATDAWLVTSERRPDELLNGLRGALAEWAAVTDQSSGYAVLRLSGLHVRAALARIVPIDVHPRAFPIGAAASTATAHIAITLWRCADAPDGAVFDIAVPRSFAGSFWHVLTSAAAEFGFEPRAQR
ncbi:MAG TPA: sarcosine oxidase subunit gamma family protein [Steroidobacteraceae bacterium]